MELDVLYLDNHLLVVNKPAGVLVQGDRTGDPDLLSEAKAWLKAHFQKPGNVFLGLVHRLDRPVSGVIVFGRTSKGAARLSDQFRRRIPRKEYVAILEGVLQGEDVVVDYLLKEREQVRIVSADTPRAQRAELRYEAVDHRDGRTLVRVRLETGRPHQIRVQLANLGHPIIGDMRYGAKKELDGRNLALHCYRLEVEHPTRNEWMGWTAPPPDSWGRSFLNSIQSLLATA